MSLARNGSGDYCRDGYHDRFEDLNERRGVTMAKCEIILTRLETILEDRKQSLDREEQRRKRHKPVFFRADPFFKEMNAKHFNPSVMSLGLFGSRTWIALHDTVDKRVNFKLDVAIKFLADLGKERCIGWRELSSEIVPDPMEMKELYEDFSPSDYDESEVIRSTLALDAIFLTAFLIFEWKRGATATGIMFYFVLFQKLDETIQCVFQFSPNFMKQMACEIFKLENQIPLRLVQRTLGVIYSSFPGSKGWEFSADYVFWLICDLAVFGFGAPCLPSFHLMKVSMGFEYHNCHHLLHCLAHALWQGAELKGRNYGMKVGGSHDCSEQMIEGAVPEGGSSDSASHVLKRRDAFFSKYVQSKRSDIEIHIHDHIFKDYTLHTATELHRSGITLQAHNGFWPKLVPYRFFSWRATLYLPRIQSLQESSEEIWRNLLAFEDQYLPHYTERPFFSCLLFMKDLINTKEDVLLFCTGRYPIIPLTRIGDHQKVADLFTSITSRQLSNFIDPRWNAIRKEIVEYHTQTNRIRVLEFMDKYFSRPWTPLSLIAALVLLVFTIIQTVYAVMR